MHSGHPKVQYVTSFLATMQDGFADLDGISTLYEAFQHSLRLHPNNRCLGRRSNGGDFQWDTYKVQSLELLYKDKYAKNHHSQTHLWSVRLPSDFFVI